MLQSLLCLCVRFIDCGAVASRSSRSCWGSPIDGRNGAPVSLPGLRRKATLGAAPAAESGAMRTDGEGRGRGGATACASSSVDSPPVSHHCSKRQRTQEATPPAAKKAKTADGEAAEATSAPSEPPPPAQEAGSPSPKAEASVGPAAAELQECLPPRPGEVLKNLTRLFMPALRVLKPRSQQHSPQTIVPSTSRAFAWARMRTLTYMHVRSVINTCAQQKLL